MLSLGQLAYNLGRDSPSERMQNAGRSVTRWLLPLPTLGFPFNNLNVDPTTRNALLPIHKLPVEILGEIFQFSLDDDIETTSFPPLTESPLIILTQICRHWRYIIVNTPALWSTIVIPDVTKRNPQAVALWLERSRQADLSVSLITKPGLVDEDDEESYNCLGVLLSLLIPHSWRWRSLYLGVHLPHPTLVSVTPSALERITLAIYPWPEKDYKQMWDTLHQAPLLRDVKYVFIPHHVFSPPQIWTTVTRITMVTPFTTNAALSLLRGCKALQHLQLTDIHGSALQQLRFDPSEKVLDGGRVEAVELRSLIIDRRSESSLNALFDAISVPNLRSLALKAMTESPDAVGLEAVQRCLMRSKASLETFSLGASYLNLRDNETITFLSGSPLLRLKVLRIVRGFITRNFIDFLSNPKMLSSVQVVVLRGVNHVADEVACMVLKRFTSPVCESIKSVEIRDCMYDRTLMEDRYRPLVENGLNLYHKPGFYDMDGY